MSRFFLLLQFTLALASLSQPYQEWPICVKANPLLTHQPDSCMLSKTELVESRTSAYRTSSQSRTWKSTDLCRGVKPDKFCVFSSPSFNDDEGVSVITTGKSISIIATRPAFKNKNGGAGLKVASPYQEVEIKGKGIGLVATRAIKSGELIMSRTPGIMVNEKAIQKLGKKAVSELLIRAVDDLPSQHREGLLNLTTHSVANDYGDKIYKILQTNSFRTGYHDGDNPFYSLFTEVSRLNHDCRPNCAYYFDHEDFHQKVLAARDIMVGEELTIAYYDPLRIQSVRQEKLHKEWGFRCTCQRCTAGATSIAESDSRVKQIIALREELDDHSSASKASPAKAELLVSLYEEEGILTRVNEAYCRAAIEYIGVGDVENAAKYARLCIDHGLKFTGLDRSFVRDMQEFIASPTEYPQWKFRGRDREGE